MDVYASGTSKGFTLLLEQEFFGMAGRIPAGFGPILGVKPGKTPAGKEIAGRGIWSRLQSGRGIGLRWNGFAPRPRVAPRRGVGFGCSVSQHSQLRNQGSASVSLEDEDGGELEEEGLCAEAEAMSEKINIARPGVQRYLIAVEYIGTRFSGAQWQPNNRTVVGVLQEAFQQFIGQPVSIVCSSRTDAGVHALSNACHVDLERISKRRPGEVLPPYEPRVVRKAVNHFLQKNEGDITIIDVQCVPPDFHARFKASERIYFYRILSGRGPLSLFERGLAWHVPEELDVLSMQEACKVLVGCHDFSSFRGTRCQARSPIRTLDEFHVCELVHFPSSCEREACISPEEAVIYDAKEFEMSSHGFDGAHGDVWKCKATADQEFGQRRRRRYLVVTARSRSFLYHQIRLLVGVLKAVGTGDLTVDDVDRILKAKTVSAASPMAPPCGLYLGNVKYDLP